MLDLKKNPETQLKFIKLGFDEKKSQIEKFDIEKIKEKLAKTKFPQRGEIHLSHMTLDEVKKETQQIASILYKGVGLRVDMFEYEKVKGRNILFSNPEVQQEVKKIDELYAKGKINESEVSNRMLTVYKRFAKKINIFEIPIYPLNGEDSMQGATNKGPLCITGDIITMAKNTPVYIESITLGDKYDKLSIGTYIHEITHALIDRHKGVVENYYNDEFLTIFMEKVAIDQVDTSPDKFLVKCSETYRLANVKDLLTDLDNYQEGTLKYEDSLKYIQSSLYAGILFERYSNANDIEKQNILNQIKSVLNGREKVKNIIKNQKLSIENEEVFEYINKVEKYAEELNSRGKKEMNTSDLENSKKITGQDLGKTSYMSTVEECDIEQKALDNQIHKAKEEIKNKI